ncbi:MAG: BatA domain-containing protein [Planctomycetes bacterium]|nr:BatA domain-containing protein [Planctomycetota bacterium]
MTFLNPALIAGGLLFAVPLIIHLLNRQRHKRRPWAAMEFLLRAYKKQRNRLRNENLLLLLLRCLIPVLLALAIARPILDSLAGLALGSGPIHHVLVVDGTYSMGYAADGAQSPFERARGLVGRLLDRLEADPSQTGKVTLVFAGERPRFLVRGDLDLGLARSQWFAMTRPEDAASDLTAALAQVADFVEESNDPDTQVYVFSDLQRRSLGDALAAEGGGAATGKPAEPAEPPVDPGADDPDASPTKELRDTLRDVVERLQQRSHTNLHWIDTGPLAEQHDGGAAPNIELTELVVSDPVAVARTPVTVVATIKNRSQVQESVEATLEIDGSEPMRRLVTVPAGADGEAEFQVTFREPGRRRVRVGLVNDALAADDERFLAVDVRERIRILVVDGDTSSDPLQSYSHLYSLVLDPDPLVLPTFAVSTVDTLTLLSGQCTPADFDVTVLADVDRVNARATQLLVDALAAGRGVLVTYGPNTQPESLNHLNDEGLQPFRLLARLGGPAGSSVPRQATITAPDHGVFAEFEEDVYREVFQQVPIWSWIGIVPDSLTEDAIVAARLTDAERSPLIVTSSFREGKIAFVTSAPASEYRPTRWNLLHELPIAFFLLHGLVKWLALPAVDPFDVAVGAELTCSLPARPQNVEVTKPVRDGSGKVPLAEDPRPLTGGRFLLPPLVDTRFAGFYTFDFLLDRESGREPGSALFAVNVDPEEGDLRYVAHAEAREALGLERILTGLPAIAEAVDDRDRSELGPTFLLMTLLFVLGEAAMARYVSIRRS